MKNMPNIPGYCFTKSILVTKGLSGDRKYYLETGDGKRFLVRIAKRSEYERKQSAYRLLEEAVKIGVFVPEPVDFGYCLPYIMQEVPLPPLSGRNILLPNVWMRS